MTLRAVFLDAGNTLLREEPSRFALYARAAEARGRRVSVAEMGELMKRAHRALPLELDGHFRYSDPWFEAFIDTIFGEYLGFPGGELTELRDELFSVFEDPRSFVLFPGAHELLEDLRGRGLVVGIVSNWSARLPRVLSAMDLAGRVDFALASAIEGAEKPDARIFHAALERAGVGPEEALHAGDHPRRDVEGAEGVGMEAILVDHSGTLANPAGGAERVRSLDALRRSIAERMEPL